MSKFDRERHPKYSKREGIVLGRGSLSRLLSPLQLRAISPINLSNLFPWLLTNACQNRFEVQGGGFGGCTFD